MCAVTRLGLALDKPPGLLEKLNRHSFGSGQGMGDREWGTVGPRFDVLIFVALFDTIITSMSMIVILRNWLLTDLRLSHILHFSTQESSSDQRGHGFPPGTLPNAIRHRPLSADDSAE